MFERARSVANERPIKMGSTELTYSQNITYLGMTFNKSLSVKQESLCAPRRPHVTSTALRADSGLLQGRPRFQTGRISHSTPEISVITPVCQAPEFVKKTLKFLANFFSLRQASLKHFFLLTLRPLTFDCLAGF